MRGTVTLKGSVPPSIAAQSTFSPRLFVERKRKHLPGRRQFLEEMSRINDCSYCYDDVCIECRLRMMQEGE